MPSEKIGNYIDKYEVLEEVGRGGMGAVYKALHPQFKKYVAIKEIKTDLASNPEFRRRFELEVEILAQLPSHPNIVTVRDALVWRSHLFLVMDYIEGGTLRDLLTYDGVAPERGAELLDQILSGLAAIHRSAIVHRDLKPSNILIDREGIPYISDFGIARSVGVSPTGNTMGTPEYAAPELFDAGLSGGTEQQVDVYALGMVAYEMLLGEKRFRAEFPEVYNTSRGQRPNQWLRWHTDLASAARNLSEIDPTIPRPLGNVVHRMMAKDVSARYGNAGDARRDLTAWLATTEDSRGRRSGPPPDDPTIPLDQLRGGGAKPSQPSRPRQTVRRSRAGRSDWDASTELGFEETPDAAPPPSPVPSLAGGSSAPRWIWWVSGAAALVVVGAVLLVQLLFASPGFTLIVRGAPIGSEVYVDNKRVGIPSNDGSIRVFGLDATQGRRSVLVSCEGCEDYRESVIGSDGEQKELPVSMSCNGGQQDEIDYNGPMILIRAGEFIMGDDSHLPDERPAHKVLLPDFYIDKFEVTNKQYQEFCSATGYSAPTSTPTAAQLFNNYPTYPVIGVSWKDASEYAKWAGKRLPTEEEWEKAASWGPKAQKKRQWPWGDDPDTSRANLSGKPGPVGQHSNGASAYGVQDMSGNAAEWVESFYQSYPQNQVMDPDYGTKHKVVRGGGFTAAIDDLARTTFRDHQPADEKAYVIKTAGASGEHNTTIGFRCAVFANDPKLREYMRTQGSPKK